jgi:hypothetical protein
MEVPDSHKLLHLCTCSRVTFQFRTSDPHRQHGAWADDSWELRIQSTVSWGQAVLLQPQHLQGLAVCGMTDRPNARQVAHPCGHPSW